MILTCLCYLPFTACNCVLYHNIIRFSLLQLVSRILSPSIVNQNALSAVLECFDCACLYQHTRYRQSKQNNASKLANSYFFLQFCCMIKYYCYVCNFIYDQTLYITNVCREISLVTRIALLNNFQNMR